MSQAEPSATAASPREVSAARPGREPLYTRAFSGALAINLLAFGQWFSLQPIIPLLVIALGGDALMAGLAFAFYSVPSVVARPFMGQLVDRLGIRIVLAAGTLGIALCAPLYLVPSMVLMLAIRIVHGVFWAGAMTASPSLMARLAPIRRRGEAAAVFDLMPSLAQTIAPAIGVLVYSTTGWGGTFAFATVVPLLACALVVLTVAPDRPANRPASVERLPLLEPSALLPMGVAMLFMSASPLFVIYPPLIAQDHGIPITDLAIYYPIYGIFMVGSRFAIGRFIDRLSRLAVVVTAALIAIVALLVTVGAGSIVALSIGAALYASAVGIAVPTMTATVVDRAPAGRIGSAMGTYTLGYQFASGFGAAIWGFVIGLAGFPPAYVGAVAVQAALLVVVFQFRRLLQRSPVHTRAA